MALEKEENSPFSSFFVAILKYSFYICPNPPAPAYGSERIHKVHNTKDLRKIADELSFSPAGVADDAVGVEAAAEKPGSQWYIAIVGHRAERACARQLTALGYRSYVASQWEVRTWRNGRRQRVERIVLPARVFVRATEQERLKHIVTLPFINRFVTDPARKASAGSKSPVAVIPDRELELFRRMLGQDEVPVFLEESAYNYAAGEKVRVKAGRLAGLEGVVRQAAEGKKRLYISLEILGSAYVEIDKNYLEPIL